MDRTRHALYDAGGWRFAGPPCRKFMPWRGLGDERGGRTSTDPAIHGRPG